MQKPEWEIEKNEFLRRLHCTEEDFKKELCLPNLASVRHIVPLRYLKHIEAAIHLKNKVLLKLLRKIPTLGGHYPFANAEFQPCKIDPRTLKVGQKFVYREIYQSLLEELPAILSEFAISSEFCDLDAHFFFGADYDGTESMAFYIPPIIEQQGADLVIMDGIHRNYIASRSAPTNSAILIKNIGMLFPCGMRPWSDIQVISLSQKPQDINERYFDLNKNLFRDLKFLGIDG